MSEVHASTVGAAPVRPRPYNPGDAWPEPDARLLNGGPRKAPEFPVEHLGALGPWAADLAASKCAPVDYVAAPLLALASGIVGASRFVSPRPGWVERGGLWTVCVGNPSSGKSPTQEALKRAAGVVERELAGNVADQRREHEAHKMDAAAAREKWEANAKEAAKHGRAAPPLPAEAEEPPEPQAPRLMVADITPEKLAEMLAAHQRGLTLVRDELSGLLGNFGKYGGGSDEPIYLSAYSGDFSPVDRKKGGTLNAPRAFLSLTGGIQPDKWQALLTGRADDGLVPRFLPVWPDPKPRAWKVPEVDESRVVEIFRRLRSLEMDAGADGELEPRVLKLTPAAEEAFSEWYLAQAEKCDAASGFMAGFLGKSMGACLRLALTLELLEWAAGVNGPTDGPPAVSALSISRACMLFADYFEPMARRVYADAALPEAERKAVAFIKEIQARGVRTFNARQAQREWGVAGVSTAADMHALCEALIEGDCIRKIEDAKEGRGRKAISYAVNPRILQRGAAR